MDLNYLVHLASLIPALAPYLTVLALIISHVGIILGVITALVAVWHAVVQLLIALSKIPGWGSLGTLANKLLADSEVIDKDSNWLIQFLNQLSAVKPPQGGLKQ